MDRKAISIQRSINPNDADLQKIVFERHTWLHRADDLIGQLIDLQSICNKNLGH